MILIRLCEIRHTLEDMQLDLEMIGQISKGLDLIFTPLWLASQPCPYYPDKRKLSLEKF